MQTQAAELKEAREVLAQATAKALQLEKDLQEACRQLAVLAEDDQDLRDKVSLCSIWQVPESSIWSPGLAALAQGKQGDYERALLRTWMHAKQLCLVTPRHRILQCAQRRKDWLKMQSLPWLPGTGPHDSIRRVLVPC